MNLEGRRGRVEREAALQIVMQRSSTSYRVDVLLTQILNHAGHSNAQ
jgi:hypothetical protein